MNNYAKWLVVSLISVVTFLVLASLIGKFIYISPVYDTTLFKLEPSKSTLIVGASHSATAMDTDYINGAINVALSGEPLFFTYYKTKALLANNPKINHIVIAISPIHIAKYAETQLFSESSGSREAVMKYYFLLDDMSDPLIKKFSSDNIIGFLKFKLGVPFNYMSDLRVVFNYYKNNVVFTDYDFFGGVERYTENYIEQERQSAKAAFYFDGGNSDRSVSDVGIKIIKRIASLSDDYDVKITVLSTPMHPYFISKIPNSIKVTYDNLMQEIEQKHAKLRFVNLSEFRLLESKFLDGDHLNTYGAAEFSQYLSKEGLVGSPVP
jgi:hypothetical protein